MNRLWVVSLGTVIVLSACGGAAAPAPAASGGPATASAPAKTAGTAATPAATAAATAAAAAGPARKVAIVATNDLYSIQTLEVKPGEAIEFEIENTGDEKHNIVAVGEGVSLLSPDFDAGARLTWKWTAPAKAMSFKFICAYHSVVPPILVTVK
ncbi:MAG: hypothetical protein A3H36_09315 [Chloroflexi bacterium RIFCSPLOWO2_02_FULL_71_16]|nr:MAG: hypothetical protein A3H36_09315 [Chloroflexi bacterium RIFCSPLOWO2_02_FULL_71_16]